MKTLLLLLLAGSFLGCSTRIQPLLMVSIDPFSAQSVAPEKLARARVALEHDLRSRGYILTDDRKNADVLLFTRFVYDQQHHSVGRLVEVRREKNPTKEPFTPKDERSFTPAIDDRIAGENGLP